jgi:hypothetical protein
MLGAEEAPSAMNPRRLPLLAMLAVATPATNAFAQGGEAVPAPDRPSFAAHNSAEAREETRNPLRDSTFVFDQSATTQTARLEPAPQQSYVPLYELWFSLRPRYYFDEHWSVRGRFDFTKELTNNQATTYYREDVFGDIWTDLVYGAKLDTLWQGTRADLGLRALWPTSKASQANGTYVTVGTRGGVQHQFEINGEDAPLFENVHASLRFVYLHPFTTATTPTQYGGFAYERADLDDRVILSDQVQGATLVNHEFWASIEGGIQITPKLSLTGYMILLNQWHYAPGNASPATATGFASVGSVANDTQFTQETWFVAAIDYALFDELNLGLGYYNLANYLAPDGRARSLFGSDNVWWSPGARVFFDITANLDALFDDAEGHKYSKRAVQAGPQQRTANQLR